MKKHILFLSTYALLLAVGCEKDPTPISNTTDGNYAYVLNEGNWGANDSEISRLNIDNGTIEANWFSASNGRGLGDLAQDLVHYGTKLYATIHGSNTIEVVDPATGKSLRRIDMGDRGPRYIAYHEGKIYVTCYDKSVVRIDTTTYAIEAACHLSGMRPEQLCVVGERLYVCNSWEYGTANEAVYDSTLSVIDIPSFTEIAKVGIVISPATQTHALNPNRIKANNQGQLVISCGGDYKTRPAQTVICTLTSGTPTFSVYPITATNFDFYGNDMYAYATTYDAHSNPTTLFYCNETPILESYSSTLSYTYSININPDNGDLYICNSPIFANSDVYCFSKEGDKRWQVEAGVFTSKVVF